MTTIEPFSVEGLSPSALTVVFLMRWSQRAHWSGNSSRVSRR